MGQKIGAQNDVRWVRCVDTLCNCALTVHGIEYPRIGSIGHVAVLTVFAINSLCALLIYLCGNE